ncbi:hypothetical protein [Profundibacter sp.]|uniref:hypothetical protein n=1 Tax=Profundibacter sp. TaxID=3101071 RepID=UPI003D0D9DCE
MLVYIWAITRAATAHLSFVMRLGLCPCANKNDNYGNKRKQREYFQECFHRPSIWLAPVNYKLFQYHGDKVAAILSIAVGWINNISALLLSPITEQLGFVIVLREQKKWKKKEIAQYRMFVPFSFIPFLLKVLAINLGCFGIRFLHLAIFQSAKNKIPDPQKVNEHDSIEDETYDRFDEFHTRNMEFTNWFFNALEMNNNFQIMEVRHANP